MASATWDDGTQAPGLTATLAILGAVRGLMTTMSWFHDVAITPSATAQGRPVSAELGLRSDGLLAVRVRF